MRTIFSYAAWPLLLMTLVGCGGEFDSFTQLDKLRILAMAADDPELQPGEVTQLRSLVRAEPDGGQVSYHWDWCPLQGFSQNEYACPLTQQDLDELASELGMEAPSLSLGDSAEVEFGYDFAGLLQIYCQLTTQLQEQGELPDGFEVLECDGQQEITLRLEVTQPDGGRVVAIKRMVLRYEAAQEPEAINQNPAISGVRVAAPGVSVEDAAPLEEGTPFSVSYDTKYTFYLDVEEAHAQTFTPAPEPREPNPQPQRENLLATWYHEAGSYQYERTSYIDGFSEDFEVLRTNEWTAPETRKDRAPGPIQLYFVIQDERGGLGWAVRTLQLE